MTSTNRSLLVLVAAGLLAAMVGAVLCSLDPASTTGAILAQGGAWLAPLSGLYLLARNGTLLGSFLFRGILFCCGVLLLGVLFRIMHWPGGDALIIMPLAGIAGLYLAHFVRKPRKQLLDWLKLLWVLTFCGAVGGIILRQLPREAAYLPQALLWLCLLAFVRQPA